MYSSYKCPEIFTKDDYDTTTHNIKKESLVKFLRNHLQKEQSLKKIQNFEERNKAHVNLNAEYSHAVHSVMIYMNTHVRLHDELLLHYAIRDAVSRQFKKTKAEVRGQLDTWNRVKAIWIGKLKEKPENCHIALLPVEVVHYILSLLWK